MYPPSPSVTRASVLRSKGWSIATPVSTSSPSRTGGGRPRRRGRRPERTGAGLDARHPAPRRTRPADRPFGPGADWPGDPVGPRRPLVRLAQEVREKRAAGDVDGALQALRRLDDASWALQGELRRQRGATGTMI